jgi:hypothetical protein
MRVQNELSGSSRLRNHPAGPYPHPAAFGRQESDAELARAR